MSGPTVAFLSPVAESIPPQAFSHALAAAIKAKDCGMHIQQVGVSERTLIHSARNILAKGFLGTGCEWAFWWDCDMVIPPHTIAQLYKTALATNSKFVTGVYYQRLERHFPVLWKKDPLMLDGTHAKMAPLGPTNETTSDAYRHFFLFPGPGRTAPFEADVCGFGCCLTHREMFEKIPEPWFKMISGVCSEDFYFCVEAKKAGYQLIADPSLRLGHIGKAQVVYKEDLVMDEKNIMPVKA